MNGKEMDGRALTVNVAVREERTGGEDRPAQAAVAAAVVVVNSAAAAAAIFELQRQSCYLSFRA
jgi:hypothetical protein